MLLLIYLNDLIRYVRRFGLIFLTAWITTCTWDTTWSMTMESQLGGLRFVAVTTVDVSTVPLGCACFRLTDHPRGASLNLNLRATVTHVNTLFA
ncbi:hypothetical protein VPHK389_0036 [Vibrio phage K389]